MVISNYREFTKEELSNVKVERSLKIKQIHIYLYFIATKKVCPCGRYRQPNSILLPGNHIQKSSKIIFNGSFIK